MKITLPYPPSANRYWRTFRGHTVVSDEARKYKVTVGLAMKAACGRIHTGAVVLIAHFYRPQKSGDLDNRLKVLCDALNGHAWHDDKQVEEIHAYRFDDKANPRVEVEVRALGVEGVLAPLPVGGHVVTPAFQREQTAAVVPRRTRGPPINPEAVGDYVGNTPKATVGAKKCECGHGEVMHQSFFTACIADGCGCTAYKQPKR